MHWELISVIKLKHSARVTRPSILVSVLLLLLTWWPLCSRASSEYDKHFQEANTRFLQPYYGTNWGLLKAQGIAESNLDPMAVSSAGAVGMMQFMYPAWSECQRALRFRAPRQHPRMSVLCGGWYMSRMMQSWRTKRRVDQYRWGWSSYNYGLTAARRAYKRSACDESWWCARECLPRETRNYVLRIERIRMQL